MDLFFAYMCWLLVAIFIGLAIYTIHTYTKGYDAERSKYDENGLLR